MPRVLQLSSKVLLVGAFVLSGCGDLETHWEDGNYRVYSRPHSREIILGYYKGDGAILGLSEPTVTAAGSNVSHVVYQINSTEHYYIVREEGGEGASIGPFDKANFSLLVERKGLPPFQWHY